MVQHNHLKRTSKHALSVCCSIALILCLITSASGLRSISAVRQSRLYTSCPRIIIARDTSLHLVDPDTSNILTATVIPFLQGLQLPNIPTMELPKTEGLTFLNPLLTSGVSSLGWFAIFDAARFPFLPTETIDFLLTLPVIVRMGLGFLAIDVLPAIADVIFLRIIWMKFIAVKTPYKDINIDLLPKQYDVPKIAAYYESNPRLVLARTTEIVLLAKDFLFGLLSDYQKGILKTNQPIRAIQFTELITTLGPTFIKVGQALSIRPDLASPAYLEELVKLQDQVPPFSSKEALKIIGEEWKSKLWKGKLCFFYLKDAHVDLEVLLGELRRLL